MNRRLPPGVVHAVAGVAGLKPLPRPQLICIEPRKSFTGGFGAQFEPFADECRLLLANDFLEQVSDARGLLDHEAVEVAPETGARSLSRSKFWHPNLPGMSSKKACTA